MNYALIILFIDFYPTPGDYTYTNHTLNQKMNKGIQSAVLLLILVSACNGMLVGKVPIQ